MRYELYQSKENRDKRFLELKTQGINLRKCSISNQLLHPQYVADFGVDERTRAIQADNRLGNYHYKTHFPKLYSMESI